MQKLLTTNLLQLLIRLGYQYVLVKRTAVYGEDADTCIILTPVKFKPVLAELSENYNAFFEISKEPFEMAKGVNGAIVLVDISVVKPEHPIELYFSY
jgi:hypothetical protein